MSTYTRTRWGLKVCIIFSAFLFILGGIFTLNTLNKDIKAEEVSTSEGGAKRAVEINKNAASESDEVNIGKYNFLFGPYSFRSIYESENGEDIIALSYYLGGTSSSSWGAGNMYCGDSIGVTSCEGKFPKGYLYKYIYGVNDNGEAMAGEAELGEGPISTMFSEMEKYLTESKNGNDLVANYWENRHYFIGKILFENDSDLMARKKIPRVMTLDEFASLGFLKEEQLGKRQTNFKDVNSALSILEGTKVFSDRTWAFSSGGMMYEPYSNGYTYGAYDRVKMYRTNNTLQGMYVHRDINTTGSEKEYTRLALNLKNPYLKANNIYIKKRTATYGRIGFAFGESWYPSTTAIGRIKVEGQGPFEIEMIKNGVVNEDDIEITYNKKVTDEEVGEPISNYFELVDLNEALGEVSIINKVTLPGPKNYYVKIRAKDLYDGPDALSVYPGGIDDPDRTITRIIRIEAQRASAGNICSYTPASGLKIGVNTTKGAKVGSLLCSGNQGDVWKFDRFTSMPDSETTIEEAQLFDVVPTDQELIYDVVLKDNITIEKNYDIRIWGIKAIGGAGGATADIHALEYIPPVLSTGLQSSYTYTYKEDAISHNTSEYIDTARPSVNTIGYENDTYTYQMLNKDKQGNSYPDSSLFSIDADGNLKYIGSEDLIVKSGGYKILVEAKSKEHEIIGTDVVTINVEKKNPNVKFSPSMEYAYTFVKDEVVPIEITSEMENATITYTSSNLNVATIQDHNFKMVGGGKFKLTAAIAETDNYKGRSISREITISTLPLQSPKIELTVDETFTWTQNNNIIQPTVSGGQGDGAIAWEILDNSPVASINPGTGEITVLSAGTFTLRVTKSGGGIYQDAIEEVVIDVLPLKVNVKPNSITQTYGQYWNSVDKQGVSYSPMNDILQADIDNGTFGTLEINSRYSEYQKTGIYANGTIASGLTSNGNYEFDYDYGELVIEDPTLTSDENLYYQIRSGALGENQWYTSDIILESLGLDGYDLISNDGIVFGDATILKTEGEYENQIYLRNSTTGVIAGPIAYTSKIDKSDPVLAFTYENKTKSLMDQLRTFSFDHYFDDVKVVKFQVEDAHSGAADVTYTISEIDADGNVIGTPIEATGTSYELEMSKKYRISATAKDLAGRSSKTVEETVILSDEVNTVSVDALDSQGQAYTTQTWTSDEITLTPKTEGGYPVDHWSYVLDDTTVDPMPSESVTIPNTTNGKHKIRFTAHQENGLKPEASYEVWVDTLKPDVVLQALSNDVEITDGATLSDSVIIKLSSTTNNASGVTYKCSTDQTTWQSCDSEFTISEGGTYAYDVKAVSGAGVESEPQHIGFTIVEYEQPTIAVSKDGTAHTSGAWTNKDLIFTISGGMKDTSLLQGYEYTTTTTLALAADAVWTDLGNASTLTIDTDMSNVYYWFRAKGCTSNNFVSEPFIVNRDTIVPEQPTFTIETVNDNIVAKVINTLSFGQWMNESVEVTSTSSDTGSGIAYYEIQEIKESGTETKRVNDGKISYTSDIKTTLIAVAYDQAGNASIPSEESGEILIDKTAPSITGVKDQSEYKQYYIPRIVTIDDAGSGVGEATYTKDGGNAISFTEGVKESIEGVGTYVIHAKDIAENEITLTFKLVPFPDLDDIDGSDESKEIIDQIQKELDEVRDSLDKTESSDYDKWIDDATDSWTSQRLKEVVHQETTSKVQGVDHTTFDPNVELKVESMEETSLPETPKKPLKGYRVYLEKAGEIVEPSGTVKVYLPYTEEETPVVYKVDEPQKVSEMSVTVEGDYVTFHTTKLSTYAISNVAQPDSGTDDLVCTVGPDNKPNTSDDVCGKPNENGDKPIVNPDGSITIPDGGSVIFPDGSEVVVPDGGTIKPDGSVETPDKDYNPDGSIKDPDDNNGGNDKPNPDEGIICSVGPDGKPNTSDDVCGKPNENGDKPVENPDGSITIPDGGTIIFPDGSEVVVPDGGTIKPDGSVETPDKDYNPDGSIKDPDDNNGNNDKPNPTPNPDDGNKPDNKPNPDEGIICSVGPDGKPNTSDDVCGKPNENGDKPVENPDGSITIPDGGSVIFPDGSEVVVPDGGTIKPDGSVETPDKGYNPDGSIKDPDDNNGNHDKPNPTPNPDNGNNDKPNPAPNPDDGNKPDNKPNPDEGIICSVGPDGKPNTGDDVCGKPNENGDKPVVNPDGSITIPDGGAIIFPDGSEVVVPDGGTIKPDGSVETPDKDYKPDGSIKDPDDQPDYDVTPDLDSDGDGKPDINIDYDCDGKADLNIDTNNDQIPDINIDTTGDTNGKPNYNIDLDKDGIPDVNIGPVKWKPNVCKTTSCGKPYCTSDYFKPYLNIDTDEDGRPDVNIDLTGNKEPDLNVDIDGDHIPDIDIDSTGDMIANVNVDENGDGRPDHNLAIITAWSPTLDVDASIKYDTMPNIEVDEKLTPSTWQSSTEYKVTHKPGSTGTNVDTITTTDEKTSYTGGANTGNITKTVSLWAMVLVSGCISYLIHYIKKHKSI